MVSLWAELGTPQAHVDSKVVACARSAPEQWGLHRDDVARLAARREQLGLEKRRRDKRVAELRAEVAGLWERLGVEGAERRAFETAHRGCGLRSINEWEDELARLRELKRQNLHLFIEDARCRLQALWDALLLSEDEMLAFAPAFADVHSDALLEAHECEIERLDALRCERAPLLAAVQRHAALLQDRHDLAASSQDASRLLGRGQPGAKRDPGKLLREEKMRKRIAKDLPRVEAELRAQLDAWENEYGRPFCVRGERYLDELVESAPGVAPPAPPRSKTPNASAPCRDAPRSAPRSQAPSRNAPSRTGTARAAPHPPRSKTPIATSTIAAVSPRKPLHTRSTTASSPSKIPAATRLPLSNLRDGPNSPERRAAASQSMKASRPPPPPPQMKALFASSAAAPADATPTPAQHAPRRAPGGGDPYRDTAPCATSMASSGTASTHAMAPPPRPTREEGYFPLAPPSRQASATSSAAASGTTATGSENWETYTEGEGEWSEGEGEERKRMLQRGGGWKRGAGAVVGGGRR